ncbi:MAG: hypothetical protein ACOCTO_02355 [Marinilabiliaceae bacterium]
MAKVGLVLADIFGIDINEGIEKMINDDNIPNQLIKVVVELDKTGDSQI